MKKSQNLLTQSEIELDNTQINSTQQLSNSEQTQSEQDLTQSLQQEALFQEEILKAGKLAEEMTLLNLKIRHLGYLKNQSKL